MQLSSRKAAAGQGRIKQRWFLMSHSLCEVVVGLSQICTLRIIVGAWQFGLEKYRVARPDFGSIQFVLQIRKIESLKNVLRQV